MPSNGVRLEHTIGVKIERREIGIDNVVRVRYLAVSDEHDACRWIHVRQRIVAYPTTRNLLHTRSVDARQTRPSQTRLGGILTAAESPELRNDMPLNEHEQKILDEIERQLYEDDPKLAEMVSRAVRGGRHRWKMRLAVVAFVVGAVVMFASFTSSWAVAGIGFLIMVGSAGWMAITVRMSRSLKAGSGSMEAILGQLRQKWRRDV
jgi:hypothetical protein